MSSREVTFYYPYDSKEYHEILRDLLCGPLVEFEFEEETSYEDGVEYTLFTVYVPDDVYIVEGATEYDELLELDERRGADSTYVESSPFHHVSEATQTEEGNNRKYQLTGISDYREGCDQFHVPGGIAELFAKQAIGNDNGQVVEPPGNCTEEFLEMIISRNFSPAEGAPLGAPPPLIPYRPEFIQAGIGYSRRYQETDAVDYRGGHGFHVFHGFTEMFANLQAPGKSSGPVVKPPENYFGVSREPMVPVTFLPQLVHQDAQAEEPPLRRHTGREDRNNDGGHAHPPGTNQDVVQVKTHLGVSAYPE